MKTISIFALSAIGAFAFAGIAQSANAADFTITVPVDIRALPPEVTEVGVTCVAARWPSGSTTSAGSRTIASFPHEMRRVSGGAYRGEFTVSGNAGPGVDPAQATHFDCELQLQSTLRGVPTLMSGHNRMADGVLITGNLPLADGAPFLVRVTGALPRS